MSLIEDALADIESRQPGEDFLYTDIAATHGVNRTTLSRRHRGVIRAVQTKAFN